MRLPYIIEIHANPGFPQSNSSNRKSVHPSYRPFESVFVFMKASLRLPIYTTSFAAISGVVQTENGTWCRHETAPAIAKPKFGSAIRIRQSGRSSVFEVQFIYGINVQRSSKYILFHTTYIGCTFSIAFNVFLLTIKLSRVQFSKLSFFIKDDLCILWSNLLHKYMNKQGIDNPTKDALPKQIR